MLLNIVCLFDWDPYGISRGLNLQSISQLRKEIDAIDDELMKLMIKRLMIAKELGKTKKALGLPLVDKDRELSVVSKWLGVLIDYGVDLDSAMEFAHSIVKVSTSVQVGSSLDMSVTIVGAGRLGKVLSNALGRITKVSLIRFGEAPSNSDLVILTTKPTPDVINYLDANAERLRGAVVADAFSVKTPMFSTLERESVRIGFRYVSIHPLFGDVLSPIGETVVVVPSMTSGDGLELVKRVLTYSGFNVVLLNSPEEHDRVMAYIQAMHHLVLLAMFIAFKEAGIDMNGPLITHSLRYTLMALDRVVSQVDVIEEIQRLNPYSRSAREALTQSLKRVLELVEAGRLGEVVSNDNQG